MEIHGPSELLSMTYQMRHHKQCKIKPLPVTHSAVGFVMNAGWFLWNVGIHYFSSDISISEHSDMFCAWISKKTCPPPAYSQAAEKQNERDCEINHTGVKLWKVWVWELPSIMGCKVSPGRTNWKKSQVMANSLYRNWNKYNTAHTGKNLKNLKILLGVCFNSIVMFWVFGNVSVCFWFSVDLICFSEWEVKQEFVQN